MLKSILLAAYLRRHRQECLCYCRAPPKSRAAPIPLTRAVPPLRFPATPAQRPRDAILPAAPSASAPKQTTNAPLHSPAKGGSYALPLHRQHLKVHAGLGHRSQDFLLLPMAHLGIKLDQVFFSRHGYLEIVERDSQLREKIVDERHQVVSMARRNPKHHVAGLEIQ